MALLEVSDLHVSFRTPDGTVLATGGDDTELKLWPLSGARPGEIGPEPSARLGGGAPLELARRRRAAPFP